MDGLAAVRAVRENDYALVLMDVQMPHMDGLQATRLMRTMPDRVPLPIIAVTANAFEGDRQRCFEAGMNDFPGQTGRSPGPVSIVMRWLTLGSAPPRPERKRRRGRAVTQADKAR